MVAASSSISASTQTTQRATAIVEVDRETFVSILGKLDKPLMLARTTRVPRGYVYVVAYSDYFFVLKEKTEQDFSRWADVIPVKRFYQGWAMSTI